MTVDDWKNKWVIWHIHSYTSYTHTTEIHIITVYYNTQVLTYFAIKFNGLFLNKAQRFHIIE